MKSGRPFIGQMNRRVDVYKPQQTQNEIGQTSFTYSLAKTVWAQIASLSGSSTFQSTETIISDATQKVIVRYKSGLDIAVGDYLEYKGRRFRIQYINNPDEANWVFEFYCQEVQDG